MLSKTSVIPKGWLAFELNVLRRLKFNSIAIPFTGEANLGTYLKRWNVRIAANDLLLWSWTSAVANIQNNHEIMTEGELDVVLEDAYVPRYRLQNKSLRHWFNETDSWWFDNVRQNIEKLSSPVVKSIALSLGMAIGDYVLSFDEETLELRQPLSTVYKRLWSSQLDPINNNQNNPCTNRSGYEFLAENYTDLMFLRLPRVNNLDLKNSLGFMAWREEWIRGNDTFWNELEESQVGRLGTHVETKFQYLKLVEETLKTASHIPTWAISHVEDGFITTQDIVETISKIRKVDSIFTKDFSELTGTKAVIITA
jgi:hypothetical protein